MLRRRVVVNLGVFAVVGALFTWWAVTNIISVDALERPFRVTADFENAMGVLPNAEVTYLGTQAGLVDKVERLDGKVRVTMKIARGEEIPAHVTANIFRKSVLGEQFIDFLPPEGERARRGSGGGRVLKDGDHIPLSRTTIPIEFADMLRAADTLLTSIDPADLHTLTGELALALQGRTDDLRALITGGDRLSSMLAERTDTLDRLAENNTRLTRVFAAHSGSLEASVRNLRQVATTLGEVKETVPKLVDEGTALFADAAPLLRDARKPLTCVLDVVNDVLDITTSPKHLEGLEQVFRDWPPAIRQLGQTLDIEEGPDGLVHQWVRVGLVDSPDDRAEDFRPNKETPPPRPGVPACKVSFAGDGAPQSGEGLARPRAGLTPATGGALGLTGGLGLAMLLAALRWRRR